MDVDRNASGSLYSVAMEVNARLPSDGGYFDDRLNGSELVVGVHDGDERGFGAESAADIRRVDNAGGTDPQVIHGYAFTFQLSAGIEHRGMLDGGGDYVQGTPRGGDRFPHSPKDCEVVGFRASA